MAQIRFQWLVMFAAVSAAYVSVAARADVEKAAAPPTVASQPASRPANEIVLVRVGSSDITQEDFNNRTAGEQPDKIKKSKAHILRKMIGERMLILYLRDHPEVLDKSKIDAAVEEAVKKEGVKNRAELEAKLKAAGKLSQLQAFLDMKAIILGRGALIAMGEKLANDENVLKQVFEKTPADFNGTRVRVRHILVTTNPWDSSDQLKAKWNKLARMRQDILAGRRTWEECVEQSDDIGTRMIGGDLGMVPRHMEKTEAFAKVAFETKQGEISEVFETPVGYHILQVTGLHNGELKYEDAKTWLRLYLMQEKVIEADREAVATYKVVGVREPDMPPPRPPKPPTTKPAKTIKPSKTLKPTRLSQAARPGATSRPSPVLSGNRSMKRPSMGSKVRPTTRPATRPSQKPIKK